MWWLNPLDTQMIIHLTQQQGLKLETKLFLDVCIDFMGGQNYAFLGVKPCEAGAVAVMPI